MEISSIDSADIAPRDSRDKRCAPGLQFSDGACMPLDMLVQMGEAYNKFYPQKKIILSERLETLNPKRYKRYLVREFGKRLKDVCDNQKCWIKQKFIKVLEQNAQNDIINYTFRPDGPNGQFTWLNTHNVNNVMEQYEKIHNDFKFFGAVPIDFAKLNGLEIAETDIKDIYQKGYKKIGVVFNLDEHNKPGSHWVASYADLENGKSYFFDSYGTEPPSEVRKFMRRIDDFFKQKNIKNVDVRHNKMRHQYKNSECGVYSLNFIIRMLEGESFDQINGQRLTDDEVNRMRDIYFR